MYINKNFSLRQIITFSGSHMLWITLWATAVTLFYEFIDLGWVKIPWLPISLIGTAVAFYIGFKNNSAYDRLWEARKIWGAIINSSRAWGSVVKAFVTDQFTDEELSESALHEIKRKLIYRHIAWLYTLRSQLLIPTSWEHLKQGKHVGKLAKKRRETFGIGLYSDEDTARKLTNCLPPNELDRLINYKNTATQIIDQQSDDLKELRKLDIIEDFRHMEMQGLLNELYVHQGKCERIKKFPLPRQYGSMSAVFVGIFIFLLPLGMVTAFSPLGPWGIWLSIPFTGLIGWVYMMMELVGDYSENPFEGMPNDIPMLALCRTIEIDLMEMLGETDIPPAIEPREGILL